MDERELLDKARQGDGMAMEALINAYYSRVFAFFYKNTGDYHQSKDLTQETFIKMVGGISGYRPQKPFKNWLFTIASNHLKNYYRSLSHLPERLELTEEYAASNPEFDVKSDISTAISHLPPVQRQAVILRYYFDFPIKDIAKITGARESTVKARLRYALEKLRKELTMYDE